MTTLFPLKPTGKHKKPNPCVTAFGYGPVNTTCASCAKLRVKRWGGKYFKCTLRGDTNGPGTDHRATWPACAKYVLNPEHKKP